MIYASIITIVTLATSALYYYYFSNFELPLSQEKLGQLGDFIGGNLNPLLTFISIIILIKTVSLQSRATALANESQTIAIREAEISRREAVDAHRTIKEQGKLAEIQIFENSFLNLIRLCTDEYMSTEVQTKTITYKGSKAFSALEKKFQFLKDNTTSPTDLFEALDEHNGNICYEILKSFSVPFKLIIESAPADLKEKYTSMAISLMPTHAIYILCIAKNHSTWGILKPYIDCGVFEKKGIINLLQGYK